MKSLTNIHLIICLFYHLSFTYKVKHNKTVKREHRAADIRAAKHTIGLFHFHAKKPEHVIQEIYSRLTMYNFTELIASHVVIQSKAGRKHTYKVNFSATAYICRQYFRCLFPQIDPQSLILKFISPVRPNRSYPRKIKSKAPLSLSDLAHSRGLVVGLKNDTITTDYALKYLDNMERNIDSMMRGDAFLLRNIPQNEGDCLTKWACIGWKPDEDGQATLNTELLNAFSAVVNGEGVD